MISMTLGLCLMALTVGTIDNVLRASRVSAEATETIERGYFLMDAMDSWLAETLPISHNLRSEGSTALTTLILSEHPQASFDLCDTPDIAVLPTASAGIALLEPGAWSCIPRSNPEVDFSALLVERRLPCQENCYDAGFYAVPTHCTEGDEGERDGDGGFAGAESAVAELENFKFEGDSFDGGESEVDELFQHQIVWLDADHDRSPCFANETAFKVTRSVIYFRDYSWHVGDGIGAVMVRELAQEPEARWLRSSMLAHGIGDWQIECLFGCEEVGDLGSRALLATAIDLRFKVNSRSQSLEIQRVLSPSWP